MVRSPTFDIHNNTKTGIYILYLDKRRKYKSGIWKLFGEEEIRAKSRIIITPLEYSNSENAPQLLTFFFVFPQPLVLTEYLRISSHSLRGRPVRFSLIKLSLCGEISRVCCEDSTRLPPGSFVCTTLSLWLGFEVSLLGEVFHCPPWLPK